MNLAVYGNGLDVLKNDVMNHVDYVAFVNPHSCSKNIRDIPRKIYHKCYCKGIPLVEG